MRAATACLFAVLLAAAPATAQQQQQQTQDDQSPGTTFGMFLTADTTEEIAVHYETMAELERRQLRLNQAITDLDFSRAGEIVIASGTNLLFFRMPDLTEIETVANAHPTGISHVAAAEGWAASADGSGRVNFWRVRPNGVELVTTEFLHNQSVSFMEAEAVPTADNRLPYLVSAGEDGKILFTSFSNQNNVLRLDASAAPRRVYRFTRGVWAWLGQNFVNQWNQRRDKIFTGQDFPQSIVNLDIDDTTHELLLVMADGSTLTVNLDTQERNSMMDIPPASINTQIVYRGGYVYYGNTSGEMIRVELESEQARAFVLHENPVEVLEFGYWNRR